MTDDATLASDDAPPAIPEVSCWLVLDAAGVVLMAVRGNVAPDGGQEVAPDVFSDAFTRPGRCALVGGVLVDHEPPTPPVPMPVAVSKLGLVRALIASGDWPKVRGMLEADADLLWQWNAASIIAVADPMTKGMIGAMGYTDEQVAALMHAAVAASA